MPTSHQCKEVGNEHFKEGRFEDAIGLYTEGLTQPNLDSNIRAALLCNRAAAFLKSGAYQHARRDAQLALQLEPSNEKARFLLISSSRI
jgi:tetratricopeptide (TPR) repeat protein